jgi:hypothetical protein
LDGRSDVRYRLAVNARPAYVGHHTMAMTRLQPNKKKILEAILFLIEKAEESRQSITQYEIVKSIFVADLFHLKKFGRPISFDNYSALPFGPVPSEAYDMLKPSYHTNDLDESEWPPWDRSPSPVGGPKAFRFHNLKRPPNKRKLSQSDMNELVEALGLVKQLGFSGVRDWTHLHRAYKSAWDSRGDRRSHPMDYMLLVEGGDRELVLELAHASKHM